MAGQLYICATPIGNLEDITIRVLRTLQEVDFIAAEDTRHTIKLLNHFEINKKMVSCHEHNELNKSKKIIERILDGESCALVSDAGTPGISDPGSILIKEAILHNVQVIVLPGPTALVSALVISGLATDRFAFEGFLSHKKSERVKSLKKLINEERTLIFYESPHRLLETLRLMMEIFGNRKMSISREITKKFEETVRGDIALCIDYFTEQAVRGEFVIVVEGNDIPTEEKSESIDIKSLLEAYIEEGMSRKDAVNKISADYSLNKNEVYKKSIEIK
jgi:16S rRNA (cytidine1402-2'-O)-methyltransferase